MASNKVGPKDKSKSDLVEEIMRTAYGTAKGRNVLTNKRLRDLQKMAGNFGIDKKKMMTHRTRNEWEKQGKGLLQVMYERVWIDASGFSKYNMRVVDEYW